MSIAQQLTPLVTRCRDRELWDSYVASRPDATNYHRWVWGEVIQATYGHTPHYLAAHTGEGPLQGVLPLIEMKSRLFGHFLVSMPFFSYGGVLASNDAARDRLLAEAAALAQQLGAGHVELRQGSAAGLAWTDRTPKVTMVFPLPATAEKLWAQLTTGMRNKVRNARKQELRVEWAGREALPVFYRIFATNMRDLGTPVYPRSWFENMSSYAPQDTRFVTIWDGGEAVASGIVTSFRDTVELPWSASLLSSRKKYSAVLMYWSVLEWALAQGFRRVDFGRCTQGSGTYEFKRHFGCEEIPLHWYFWLAPGKPVPELRPSNRRFHLATRVWQRLPLVVANGLGPHIVRSIP
jgi:FemAB-related protein (PEP-CTERM system-associated)